MLLFNVLKDFLDGVSIVDQLFDGGHQFLLYRLTLLVLDELDDLEGEMGGIVDLSRFYFHLFRHSTFPFKLQKQKFSGNI